MEIKQAIIHVLDRESESFVCSQRTLDLNEYATRTYLEGILKKFNNADVKIGQLEGYSDVVSILQSPQFEFVEQSSEIAKLLFEWITQSEDVPGGDFLYFQAEKNEENYIGMVKLNYKPAYTHYVDYVEEQMLNNIIINKTILPALTQRLEEAVVINLTTMAYELVEKKYKFDGQKVNYFSEKFLKVQATPTATENIAIVKKAMKEVAAKYNEEKYVSMSNVQQAVVESLEIDGTISKELIAEKVFEDNFAAKQEYLEKVEQTSFVDSLPVNVPKYEKKYSKQKLKLANGIEMTIPLDVYQNKELIEFINNPDGTISVMIKNVDEIINKF